MHTSTSMRWLVVAVSAAMLLAVAAACSSETIEVPGETVVVKEEVIKTVEVPGETVTVEVIKEVQVPGETVVVKEEVVKEVMVPGETVVVEKVVTETVEVPGETVTVEVVKEVQVPGETVVVEKEVVKTVEVPGETVVVTKEVLKVVEVRQGYVTDPTTGNAVTAPQYGGTITVGRIGDWAEHPDGYYIGAGGAQMYISLVNEMLSLGDWGIDRNVYSWRSFGETPLWALKGALAESWDISPDGFTYTFHIRKGVHWHNKAPMNGRELTAEDVEYNLHRLYGNKLTGTEFSAAEPSPSGRNTVDLPIESVTATDKYTMVVKLKKPSLIALKHLLGHGYAGGAVRTYPPEVIEEHGDYKDWRNTVGTGPYELPDVVDRSSIAWTKNPDYWGYDEKYPENRLPYVDKITQLVIPERATRIAALRSGKIDMLGSPGSSNLRSIDVVDSLKRTSPEIDLYGYKFRSDNNFYIVHLDIPPLNDIRVRQAMQMALDLDTIIATYYKGYGDATPQGHFANDVPWIGTPFEEWPEEVKKTYRYDPEGAEALLDAAGYPRGADGIRIKMNMAFFDRYDLSYAELVAGYWRQIGVETEIDVLSAGAVITSLYQDPDQDKYIIRWGEGAFRYGIPGRLRSQWYKGNLSTGHMTDPEYDAMVDAIFDATTIEGQYRLIKEVNMYITEKHFKIWGPETPQFHALQPWVKGFNGEIGLGLGDLQQILARLWIDQEMKEAMGQ